MIYLCFLIYYKLITGQGKFDKYLEKEKIYPSVGPLSKFGRQARYKIWAAMEIRLLEDDRKPGASDSTYQSLTEKGKALFDIMQKHQAEMPIGFFDFRTNSKTDLSWDMIKN